MNVQVVGTDIGYTRNIGAFAHGYQLEAGKFADCHICFGDSFHQREQCLADIAAQMNALALSFEETQVLLKSGNCSLLSAARERDLVIMSGIANELDYETVNKELTEKGMPDLNVRF